MKCLCSVLAALVFVLPFAAFSETTDKPSKALTLELNTLQDVEGACRLTFVAENATGTAIDNLGFETVVFDTSGGVVTLALYNFQDLPSDVPRVRQFRVRDIGCDQVGRVLINGISTCVVGGSESDICAQSLTLRSRTEAELLG